MSESRESESLLEGYVNDHVNNRNDLVSIIVLSLNGWSILHVLTTNADPPQSPRLRTRSAVTSPTTKSNELPLHLCRLSIHVRPESDVQIPPNRLAATKRKRDDDSEAQRVQFSPHNTSFLKFRDDKKLWPVPKIAEEASLQVWAWIFHSWELNSAPSQISKRHLHNDM